MPLIEELPELITLLRSVPILGRILIALGIGESLGDKTFDLPVGSSKDRQTKRKTRIKNNARYVLKASDAMQCVEDHLLTRDGYAISFLKNLLRGITPGAKPGALGPGEAVTEEIFACIEKKVLSQKSERKSITKFYSARPAKGHGKGRIKQKKGLNSAGS